MTTLYLDRRGMAVKIKSGALAVYQGGIQRTTVPLKLLERLVVRGDVELTSSVLYWRTWLPKA